MAQDGIRGLILAKIKSREDAATAILPFIRHARILGTPVWDII